MKTYKLVTFIRCVDTEIGVFQATFARALRKVFERELTILRLCKHPNIIQLLQSIETPEVIKHIPTVAHWNSRRLILSSLYLFQTAYLVLELCEQSLFNVVVERGGLRESEMRRVVRAASAGLTYLHSKGKQSNQTLLTGLRCNCGYFSITEIAHRDLKLTNILCSRNPQDGRDLFWSIKLSDFGLAACRGNCSSRAKNLCKACTFGLSLPFSLGPSGTRRLFTCYCGTPEFMGNLSKKNEK